MLGSHRRTCQYRRAPKRRGGPRAADDGASSVRGREARCESPGTVDAVASAARSVGAVLRATPSAAKRRPKAAATGFAAAVAPTSSSTAAPAASKHTGLPSSAPLLGAAVQGRPPKPKKPPPGSSACFSRGGASSRAPRTPARKLPSPTRTKAEGSSGSRQKRRGIAAALRNPLTKVSLKWAALGKGSKRLLPVPPLTSRSHSKDESSTGSRTSGAPVPKAKGLSETRPPEERRPGAGQGGGGSPPSAEKTPQGTLDIEAWPPFAFDAADANPFRSPGSTPPSSGAREDCLSASSHPSTASSCSEGYQSFLDFITAAPDTDDRDERGGSPSLREGAAVAAHDAGWGTFAAGGGATSAVDVSPGGAAEVHLDYLLSGDAVAHDPPVPSQDAADRCNFDPTLPNMVHCKKEGEVCTPATCYEQCFLHQEWRAEVPEYPVETKDDACSIPSLCSVQADVGDPSRHSEMSVPGASAAAVIREPSAHVDAASSAKPVPRVGAGRHAARKTTEAKAAAASALVWGGLTVLLGAPPPKSVLWGAQAPRRSRPLNLWQSAAGGGDCEDIVSLSEDEGKDAAEDCRTPSLLDATVPVSGSHTSSGLASTTGAPVARQTCEQELDATPAGSALASSLWSSDTARQEGRHLWEDDTETDLPPEMAGDEGSDVARLGVQSVDPHAPIDAEGNANACLNTFAKEKGGIQEGADSALAWGALGMLLGSPAPTSVSKSGSASKRAAQHLWHHEDGSDIIPSIDTDDGSSESVSSLQCKECRDDSVVAGLEKNVLANESIAPLEAANSVVAWSALAALLGSPLPSSLVRKNTRRSATNLWDDGSATDEDLEHLLPFSLDHTSCEDTEGGYNDLAPQPFPRQGCKQDTNDDSHSIPSLSATFENDDRFSSSPLTPGRSYEDLFASPARTSSSTGLADSTLALGHRAFSCLTRRKEAHDLWTVETAGLSPDDDFPNVTVRGRTKLCQDLEMPSL